MAWRRGSAPGEVDSAAAIFVTVIVPNRIAEHIVREKSLAICNFL
jgi:hypothetical protein